MTEVRVLAALLCGAGGPDGAPEPAPWSCTGAGTTAPDSYSDAGGQGAHTRTTRTRRSSVGARRKRSHALEAVHAGAWADRKWGLRWVGGWVGEGGPGWARAHQPTGPGMPAPAPLTNGNRRLVWDTVLHAKLAEQVFLLGPPGHRERGGGASHRETAVVKRWHVARTAGAASTLLHTLPHQNTAGTLPSVTHAARASVKRWRISPHSETVAARPHVKCDQRQTTRPAPQPQRIAPGSIGQQQRCNTQHCAACR
jgi:hypothetical protein